MTVLDLPGRILFLSDDPARIAAQLAGADLDLGQAGPLRDEIAAAVLRAGGLLAYGRLRMSPVREVPVRLDEPQTLAAKILARHAVAMPDAPATVIPGEGGFVRADLRFIHDIYTAMCRFMLDGEFGGPPRFQPSNAVASQGPGGRSKPSPT